MTPTSLVFHPHVHYHTTPVRMQGCHIQFSQSFPGVKLGSSLPKSRKMEKDHLRKANIGLLEILLRVKSNNLLHQSPDPYLFNTHLIKMFPIRVSASCYLPYLFLVIVRPTNLLAASLPFSHTMAELLLLD